MGLFGFGKKKQSIGNGVVWRDATGNITCPGDNCPKDCDDSCPIYLNTQAAMMLSLGENSKAIPIFNRMLEIAPDFYDAWNNLAAVYGGQGNYQKAKECYSKAHDLKPDRPAPVFGLALVNRDLKNFEECLKWCDVYDRLANDHRCDSVRATAKQALGSTGNETKQPRY